MTGTVHVRSTDVEFNKLAKQINTKLEEHDAIHKNMGQTVLRNDKSRNMETFWKYCFGAALTFAASIAITVITVMIYVRIYAFRLGVPLHTLSEDYGLAMIISLMAVILFTTSFFVGAWITYRTIFAKQKTRK